jgi:hypothetical protein
MDHRDALTAGLPDRRDDEPDGLRDDIIDELADHLACAYRRELLRGADGASARRRVFEKFGDPAAMARRLWLDAMWGRIMTQRILVVCCVVLAALSLAMALAMWNQSVQAQRLLHREMAAAEAARREAEVARKEMLERLVAISRANDRPLASGWIPVVFKLTQETPEGPPAVGFQASLGRGQGGWSKNEAIQRVSDEKGVVDFGVVQPGDWEFRLHRDLGTGKSCSTVGSLNVTLVNRLEKTIVCPKVPGDQVDVAINLLWPGHPDDPDVRVLAGFEHDGYTFQTPMHWELNVYGFHPGLAYKTVTKAVLGDSRGSNIELLDPHRISLWAFLDGSATGPGERLPSKSDSEASPAHLFAGIVDGASGPAPVTVMKRWTPGTYRMTQMLILRPSRHQKASFAGQRYDVLKHANSPSSRLFVERQVMPPDHDRKPRRAMANFGALEPVDSVDLDGLLPENQRRFEARSGQPNKWTIRIPDEFIKAGRKALQSEEASGK